jgi:retinol dehydrogenase 12
MVLPYKLSQFFSQSMWIPTPTLTEDNLPDQRGRVCLITGGYGGIGFEVSSILYENNATVYIAGRNGAKGLKAVETIKNSHPDSKGRIAYLKVDLADLSTIKPMVETFMALESNLHWLNNNAGVMHAPLDIKGGQGMNMQFQTNLYGPFLLTKLLLPILRQTAAREHPGSVRVTWAGSLGTILTRFAGGLDWTDGKTRLAGEDSLDDSYHVTKAGNYLLGVEFGKRHGSHDGVLHVVSPWTQLDAADLK